MLKIYNSAAQETQEFVSIQPNKVNIYVCGVTVYDYCHIGHARTYLFFDVVVRYLKFLGYQVTLVRNITDVDDKILNKAKQNNEPFEVITKKYTEAMHKDFVALNLLEPTFEPKATEFIKEMIQLIKTLLQQKHAYIGNNGDVFYSIKQFKNYGLLSKRDLNNMQNGERVETQVQAAKHDLHDFVLWKLTDVSEVGWDSPWGYGRPGWHTECAAMSLKLLGNTIDIHGGGFDLIFPHHENEISQAEAITNTKFVNYWMHVGFLQINQEKMSKSLGNFTFIKDLLTTIHPEVLRYFILSSHYRSQVEFEVNKLQVAKNSLERLYLALRNIPVATIDDNLYSEPDILGSNIDHDLNLDNALIYQQKFITAMNEDFNTPEAMAVLFELVKELNIVKEKSLIEAIPLAAMLKKLANTMGLLMVDCESFLHWHATTNYANNISEQEIQKLILERNLARSDKNWQKADQIRKHLEKQGIILEDQGGQTKWRIL